MKAENNLTKPGRRYNISKNQELRISGTEEEMAEYLQVRSNGQITLPAATRRKAKLQEGDLLEALVEDDGSIRLVPKTPVDRKLAEQYQLKDIDWAVKQRKGSKK
jgi:AbrB family looped-hinge helix DNA binding protein